MAYMLSHQHGNRREHQALKSQSSVTVEFTMDSNDRIEVDASVMQGKPVIRGTRIPVELILRKLGEGATEQDLLDAYPKLTSADIRASMAYAADALAHEDRV